ncbi:SpoIIE family protein phosphatase, partial [Bacteroidota bacterium]
IIEPDSKLIENFEDTIQKIDSGNFGKCKLCDDGVEKERLELDFTTEVCLGHYSDEKLRELERDLELASQVQRYLLPYTVPAVKGFEISAHTQAAGIVSGDYFDFFCSREAHQGFIIADVMGKGMPASILMSNLQATTRILGPEYREVNLLTARINELFRYNSKLISFITMFIGKLDSESKILTYCNAGHSPPVYWESDSQTLNWLRPTGPAIGLVHNSEYENRSLQLKKGDLLLLFTDGLIESRNSSIEEFGTERLSNFVKTHHKESADVLMRSLIEEVKSFSGEKLFDDMTILMLKVIE